MGYFVKLIVFGGVNNDMMIVCEEIFGLVFVIFLYEMEEEVIEMVNDMLYGFFGYV